MTAINQEDRRIIKTGLLKATKFKQRFQAVLAEMGKAHYEYAVEFHEGNNKELMAYIATMPDVYRRELCREVDSITTYFQLHKFGKLHWDAKVFCYREFAYGEYPRYFANARDGRIDLKFPKSLWLSKTAPDAETDHLLEHPAMTAFNLLCREFMAVELELTRLLNSIRTVKQMEQAIPEAMQFLPTKSFPVALQINPANALAALSKAGWIQEEAVAA